MPSEVFNKYDCRCETWGTQILSADIELKHEGNTYGEIKRGALRFRAQLCPLMIERKLSRRDSSRGTSERRSISSFTWKVTTTSIPYPLEIECDGLGTCLITGDCELDSAEETTRWWSFLSGPFRGHHITTPHATQHPCG